MPDSLQFDLFEQERGALEVKFPPSFLYWDVPGASWTEFLSAYPHFKFTRVDTGKIIFTSDDRFQCSVSTDSILVLAAFPNRDEIKEFSEIAERLVSIFFRSFRITEVTRAGLRFSYFCEFKDRDEASRALLKTGLVREPNAKEFGVEGSLLFPKYSVRSEGKTLGVVIQIEAQERTLGVDAPFGLKSFEPGKKRFGVISRKESGVVLDVDIFTTAPIPVGAFLVSDWISQSAAKIKRGATLLLKG